MPFFHVPFTGEVIIEAPSRQEGTEVVRAYLGKLQPGAMNVAWGVDEELGNPHLRGVSCKVVYPDGSVRDCVPFPHSVSCSE